MGQLDQLLGYLERDGVSEIILGVGRPIAMRNAAGLTNLTARPVSAEQLTSMLRGSPLEALLPTSDMAEKSVEVQIGTRNVRVRLGRRGDETVVRLSRVDAPAPSSFTMTQPMARVAEAKSAPNEAPVRESTSRIEPRSRRESASRAESTSRIEPSSPRAKTPTKSSRAKTPTSSRSKKGIDFDPSSIDVDFDTNRPKRGANPPPSADSVDIDLDTHRPKSGDPAVARAQFQRASDLQRDGGFQRATGPVNKAALANHTAPVPSAKASSVATPLNVTFSAKPKAASETTGAMPASAAPPVPGPAVAAFDGFSLDDDVELGPPLALDNSVELGQPRAPTDDDLELGRPRVLIDDGVELGHGRYDEPILSHNAENWEEDIPSLSANFELIPEDAPAAVRADKAPARGEKAPVRTEAHDMTGRAPTQQAPTIGVHASMVANSSIPKPSGSFVALVAAARERGASDLHISAARVTSVRAGSDLVPLDPNGKPLTAAEAEALLLPLIDAGSRAQFERLGYVDLALDAPGGGRLRANICRQQAGMKGTFRLALPAPLPLEQLGLPADLGKVVSHHQGLVVIAGPSGHGKTTTLAALVDLVNSTKPYHILTIEDPIELVHQRKQAVVSQREVGKHTTSFARGLKASLREDPDVIVIGELRDRESVEIALTAAETGHLVLATMSTPSASKTIDRLVDMFPPEEHSQVRASVAGALRAIVAQRLVPRRGGKGVVPAIELVTGVLPLAVMIREDKLYQLPNLMQRGRAFGMIRFDESLAELVRAGRIDEETALAFAESKKDLAAVLQGASTKTQAMWKDPARR